MENKLWEIPQKVLSHDDGWEYRITAYADVVKIEYWEKGVKNNTYTFPTCFAEQIGDTIAKLAKEAPEE